MVETVANQVANIISDKLFQRVCQAPDPGQPKGASRGAKPGVDSTDGAKRGTPVTVTSAGRRRCHLISRSMTTPSITGIGYLAANKRTRWMAPEHHRLWGAGASGPPAFDVGRAAASKLRGRCLPGQLAVTWPAPRPRPNIGRSRAEHAALVDRPRSTSLFTPIQVGTRSAPDFLTCPWSLIGSVMSSIRWSKSQI